MSLSGVQAISLSLSLWVSPLNKSTRHIFAGRKLSTKLTAIHSHSHFLFNSCLSSFLQEFLWLHFAQCFSFSVVTKKRSK